MQRELILPLIGIGTEDDPVRPALGNLSYSMISDNGDGTALVCVSGSQEELDALEAGGEHGNTV